MLDNRRYSRSPTLLADFHPRNRATTSSDWVSYIIRYICVCGLTLLWLISGWCNSCGSVLTGRSPLRGDDTSLSLLPHSSFVRSLLNGRCSRSMSPLPSPMSSCELFLVSMLFLLESCGGFSTCLTPVRHKSVRTPGEDLLCFFSLKGKGHCPGEEHLPGWRSSSRLLLPMLLWFI